MMPSPSWSCSQRIHSSSKAGVAVVVLLCVGGTSVNGFSVGTGRYSARPVFRKATTSCPSRQSLRMSIRPPELKTEEKKIVTVTEHSIEESFKIFSPLNVEENGFIEVTGDVEAVDEDIPTTSKLNGSLLPTTPAEIEESEEEEDKAELGIWAARGLLLAVAVLWGTNFASVKYLETLCFHPPCHHPPSEAALARFGVAGLVSLPLLAGQRWDVIRGGIECGVFITLGYITQALALSTIPSGKCAFICSLTVVVVPVMAAIFEGKPIKSINVVSAMIALGGVAVLEGVIDAHSLLGIQPTLADASTHVASSLDSATTTTASAVTAAPSVLSGTFFAPVLEALKKVGLGEGDLLALGQPFGFGIAFMRIEHYVEKFKDVKNRVLTISAAQCVVVGILSAFWVLYDFHGHFPNFEYMIEPHRIGAVLWTGIMTTVVAIYFEGVALQKASATEAALTFSSEPVWATLFGAWLLHEKLGLSSYVGGATILMACLLSAMADLPLLNNAMTQHASEQEEQTE